MIFGVSTDPRFGPVLMFGLGGKYVEVFRDVRFGVTPLAPLRGARHGARHPRRQAPRRACAATRRPTSRCSRRCCSASPGSPQRFPEIVELDINPFLAAPASRGKAVDARIRVANPTGG